MIPIVVCGVVGTFEDDLHALCEDCGKDIVHRPHTPEPSKKICIDCYQKIAGPEDDINVTEETIKELLLLLSAIPERPH